MNKWNKNENATKIGEKKVNYKTHGSEINV